jgi:hypothetical protein
MSYKTMYVIIAVNDWKIEQMNIKILFLYDKILSQAAVQKQDCEITWCDYSHVMWLRWLCIERNNFDSSISTYIENCSS